MYLPRQVGHTFTALQGAIEKSEAGVETIFVAATRKIAKQAAKKYKFIRPLGIDDLDSHLQGTSCPVVFDHTAVERLVLDLQKERRLHSETLHLLRSAEGLKSYADDRADHYRALYKELRNRSPYQKIKEAVMEVIRE